MDLHRDFSLQAHVFALPALRLVGVRAAMPITDPEPVERTREAFWAGAAAVAPLRVYRVCGWGRECRRELRRRRMDGNVDAGVALSDVSLHRRGLD